MGHGLRDFVWPLTTNYSVGNGSGSFETRRHSYAGGIWSRHLRSKNSATARFAARGTISHRFPVMNGHYGHLWTQRILSRRYRELYAACDLAFCTSNGMQGVLGPHPNGHVIYPMPARHSVPETPWPPSTGKFRLVYVGSVQNFYGRMACASLKRWKRRTTWKLLWSGQPPIGRWKSCNALG